MDPNSKLLLERIIRRNRPPDPKTLRSVRRTNPALSQTLSVHPSLPSRKLPALREQPPSSLFQTESKPPAFRRRVISTDYKKPPTSQITSFISAIEEREWLSEEFCYMNRGEHFYDWRLTSFEELDTSEYMVVGLRGLTLHQENRSQFYPREQFEREATQFQQVRTIPFFKTYLLCKTYHSWKGFTLRKDYLERSKLLEEKAFILHPFISEGLMRVQAELHDLGQMVAFEKRGMGAVSLSTFRTRLEEGRASVNRVYLQNLARITELVKKYCEFELERFKIVNNLEEEGSLASFGHTREAILEDERRTLLHFVKRVDYAFFTSRKEFVEQSYLNLHGIIRCYRENITMNPMLRLVVGDGFEIAPSFEQIVQAYEDYPGELFQLFRTNRQKLLFSKTFDEYRGGRPSRHDRQQMQIPSEFDD